MPMSDNKNLRKQNALYKEHLVLGATFEDGVVHRYGQEPPSDVVASQKDAAFLCDVSTCTSLLFFGSDAPSFAEAAFAGKKLNVGECAFEPALTGDGGLASVALLCRTGSQEYVALDLSKRAQILEAWLTFLAHISQDGYAPYAHMKTDDATGTHVILAFGGGHARTILADYVERTALPREGHIGSCKLDGRIPCLIANLTRDGKALYLLFLAPTEAATVWRSLLSFGEVVPVGHMAFHELFVGQAQWFARLGTTDAIHLGAQTLQEEGLLRNENDFVGARALSAQ